MHVSYSALNMQGSGISIFGSYNCAQIRIDD